MQVRCPPIEQPLLDYLESVFKDQAVDPAVTNPWQAFGEQRVIRHLKMQAEAQSESNHVPT